MIEKINIYVPEIIGNQLDNDAEMFEVYKRDGRTINKNKFLSILIMGYYNRYVSESQGFFRKIYNELSGTVLDDGEKQIIANSILQNIILPAVPSRKGKNPVKLSLKPTRETESLILSILDDLGGNDFISQYFCKMFMSYCEKSFSEREQILFKYNYDLLLSACESQISITFSTIWNPTKMHQVAPYKIAIGQEEMFNYLICAEENEWTGEQETRAYRLNRISKVNCSNKSIMINKNVLDNLNRMLIYGPQYMINSSEEICVKISPPGEKSFNRIYYGRPKIDRIVENGNEKYMYFKGSWEQAYFYFRRFGAGEAEIISPLKLRERMIRFYAESLEAYK